jgi:hypothetical protein
MLAARFEICLQVIQTEPQYFTPLAFIVLTHNQLAGLQSEVTAIPIPKNVD